MPGAVDQHIDTAEFFERQIREALEIVIGLVGAGDADAAQFLRQRFPCPKTTGSRACSRPRPDVSPRRHPCRCHPPLQ